MAGIMDMLGGGVFGGGDIYGDLLSEEQQRKMQQQAMLTMGAKLMQSGGPSTTRQGLGQALGGAFLSGQEAYGQAGQNALQGMLTKQKIDEYKRTKQQDQSFNDYLGTFMGGQQQAATPSPESITLGATPQASTPMMGGGQQMPMGGGRPMLTPEQAALLQTMPATDARNKMFDLTMRQDPEIIRTMRALGMAPTPENYMSLKKAGATSITNTVTNAADKALAGAVGPDIQKQMRLATDQAQAAQASLENMRNIEANMDQALLGPGADIRTAMLRFGSLMGVSGKDDAEILAKTRATIQGQAQAELNAASQMKGQGPLTDSERGILRKAALGDQSLTAPELRVAMQAMAKISQAKIAYHGNLLNSFKQLPGMGQYIPFYSIGGDMGSAIDAELRLRGAQ